MAVGFVSFSQNFGELAELHQQLRLHHGECLTGCIKTITYNENGDEAGERRVPVSARRCSFSNQNAVEDEITEAELHPSYRHVNTPLVSQTQRELVS